MRQSVPLWTVCDKLSKRESDNGLATRKREGEAPARFTATAAARETPAALSYVLALGRHPLAASHDNEHDDYEENSSDNADGSYSHASTFRISRVSIDCQAALVPKTYS